VTLPLSVSAPDAGDAVPGPGSHETGHEPVTSP
jgi:hypothetical protein